MKNGMIVLACLIPLALVIAYGGKDCMSEKEAEVLYKLALDKENTGDNSEAYNLYKQIDAYSCENHELRGKAFAKAVSFKKEVRP